MMREGKPELYFLLILYQNFFDLSNPNFGNIPICGGLPFSQTRLGGRYVAAFSGKSRYGEQPLDAQEKLRIDLWCGKSVRGVRPRPAKNPNLLVYHISVNLSIGNLHKKRELFSSLLRCNQQHRLRRIVCCSQDKCRVLGCSPRFLRRCHSIHTLRFRSKGI